MYKVFFNDRIIFLTDKNEWGNNPQYKGMFLKYDNEEELFRAVNFFINSGKNPSLYVYHNDVEELFNVFRMIFEYREAAGGFVRNSNDESLFIYRFDKWDLPKGHLEIDETPEKGAVREVEEECGITSPVIIDELPSTYHIYTINQRNILKRTYWFNMEYTGKEKLTPQIDEDIVKVTWVKNEEISNILSNTYPSLNDIIKQALLH
jgi:ADP-ribose pyrophosphatase YjhB (NUDIX family)